MPRNKLIALAVAGAVVVFLLGFLPQWVRAERYRAEAEQARNELRASRLQDRLGAALTESLRSNYERSRQLMTEFFGGVQQMLPQVDDPRQRSELEGILAQRDEVVTLLARAAPESTQRLMLIYNTYYQAMDPQARAAALEPPSGAPRATPERPRSE